MNLILPRKIHKDLLQGWLENNFKLLHLKIENLPELAPGEDEWKKGRVRRIGRTNCVKNLVKYWETLRWRSCLMFYLIKQKKWKLKSVFVICGTIRTWSVLKFFSCSRHQSWSNVKIHCEYTVVIISSIYFVLLNYSHKSWSIFKTKFGICWSWQFQNTPYMCKLTKFWQRYLRLKTHDPIL